ncbi:hypothetical protein [Rhizobium ruizarguesonis]|jgi:hypothetical protein|uniref:Uncharacterized protein n=2 Tax=Rhizobium ruizarguesonis TaxID=2081791 RepID=A0AAE4YVD4_9HYPH|nr:hypothetical protein [Rhizobium ruizarguesonis]NEI51920.1 hypothetical protein [Rhizobium ruizarguesonis]TAU02283.1 hypothetical protein ELI53_23460 [Rhizobium ruizarguesonis]TBD02405.1 hypothetical protein ELH25_28660 [Rhizobium ruizarguesonis]TBD18549.1 hypothetical protein ELH24_24940 [Rhizobium ruizarguesonis]TBD40289.1 hypothetical protein ELH18_23800 [Rhizobium ruizarguesonis]
MSRKTVQRFCDNDMRGNKTESATSESERLRRALERLAKIGKDFSHCQNSLKVQRFISRSRIGTIRQEGTY